MKILIESIPGADQRYPTPGDYFIEDGTLHIKVSCLGNWRAELLVAIHELVEIALVESAGVTYEQIDEFDMGHPELTDPGADPRAPYHHQHNVATAVEMVVCSAMGLSWTDYCSIVDSVE